MVQPLYHYYAYRKASATKLNIEVPQLLARCITVMVLCYTDK